MTRFLAWLRDSFAALLAKPAATIINIHADAKGKQYRAHETGFEPVNNSDPMTCADAAAARPIQTGMEVRLPSDHVWMTVVYADCTEADCAWFSGADLQTETFPIAALTTTPPMPF